MSTSSSAGRLGRVVFIRHGESIWNAPPVRFTGWANVPLTDKGLAQARESGKTLLMFGIKPNVVISSLLRRSKDSMNEIMKSDSRYKNVTVINSWRMNERHYGALVGLSKEEAAEKMGHELVSNWRKSWDIAPPPMVKEDLYAYKEAPWAQPVTIVTEPSGTSVIHTEKDTQMPLTESLLDCCNRVLPLWKEVIQPRVALGETVLIVAHANSIRAIVKHIDSDTISDENVRRINIPSAIPLVYDFSKNHPASDAAHSLNEAGAVAFPIGRPNKYGMRGKYIATAELLQSLRKALMGDNENDDAFLDMLDDGIRRTISVDTRSTPGGRGAVLIGTDRQSVVREHYAKTALGKDE